jgi:hypothetical protein
VHISYSDLLDCLSRDLNYEPWPVTPCISLKPKKARFQLVYIIHEEWTDILYRNIKEQRPTSAVVTSEKSEGFDLTEAKTWNVRGTRVIPHAACIRMGATETDDVTSACNVWGCVRVALWALQHAMVTLFPVVTSSGGRVCVEEKRV